MKFGYVYRPPASKPGTRILCAQESQCHMCTRILVAQVALPRLTCPLAYAVTSTAGRKLLSVSLALVNGAAPYPRGEPELLQSDEFWAGTQCSGHFTHETLCWSHRR